MAQAKDVNITGKKSVKSAERQARDAKHADAYRDLLIDERINDLKANPKYKWMKAIDWEIMAAYLKADQEAKDIAFSIGTIDIATTVTVLR